MNYNIGGIIFVLILIGLAVLLLWFFIFKVKHLKTPDVYMVDGGVKTGKSLVCVMLAVKQYRKNCIKVCIVNFFIQIINWFRKIGGRKKPYIPLKEKPMLYSNMPLYHVKYNELTLDILKMKVRIPHKSVCLLDEATIIADSMTALNKDKKEQWKVDELNETITLFLKLYGHSTHGGSCFYNSQNVVDLHFGFRRNTSTYLMVMKNRKYPFFCLLDVRELVHDEAGDVKNTITKDVDDDNKPLFVSKRFYRYYNRYYLDVLTKSLPLMVNYKVPKLDHKNKKDLRQIITLGNYQKIKEYNEKHTPKEDKPCEKTA